MPTLHGNRPTSVRPLSDSRLKAACSVSELAQRCGLSRARWYELVKAGVMPQPVYCLRTRRPLYPQELQELAINLRMTNTSLDGRYVLFYNRRATPASSITPRANRSTRTVGSAFIADGTFAEVIQSLRMLGIEHAESEVRAAITECFAGGLPDDFEMGLTTVFRHLRRLDRVR